MDLANLSSNWKKLQVVLSAEKKHENGDKPFVTLTRESKSLKRKAQEPSKYQTRRALPSNSPNKRQKTSLETSPEGQRESKEQSKMGAYVSSLPGASYTPQKPAASGESPSNGQINTTEDKRNRSKGNGRITDAIPQATQTNIHPSAQAGKYIGLDCEMIGTHSLTPFSILSHNNRYQTLTSTAPPEYSILARVSLVTYSLEIMYDAYVLPPSGVSICDYRTPYSGITAWHLNPSNQNTTPKPFTTVQREVSNLLAGRVLVGHALKNDLEVLGLSHPRRDIRDTARYPPFRARAAVVGRDGKLGKAKTPSLKKLAAEVLGLNIQGDEKKGHSSAEDARAAMALFKSEKAGFEREAVKMFGMAAVVRKGVKDVGTKIVSGNANGRVGQGNPVVGATQESDDDSDALDELDGTDGEEDAGSEGEDLPAQPNSRQKTTVKRKNKRKKRTKRA